MMNNIRDFLDDLGVVGIMSFIIILIIIMIFSYYAYQEISFGSHYGKIVDKEYSPGYVSGSGNSIYGHTNSYRFSIEKNGKRIWINVTKDEYDNLKIGDCYYKCE